MDFLNAKFINLFDKTKLREKFFIKKTKKTFYRKVYM